LQLGHEAHLGKLLFLLWLQFCLLLPKRFTLILPTRSRHTSFPAVEARGGR
jgi:hypothetical protein